MASFDLPEIPQARVSPALLVGVASPLWSYFGAAAAGGMAYWWMTQWARPVNLEAMFGRASGVSALALKPVADIADAAVEAVVETQVAIADTLPDEAALPVGGEAAPIGPLVQAAPAPEPEPEVIFAVAPEPVIDEPAPVAFEPTAEPSPKVRAKKTPSPESDT